MKLNLVFEELLPHPVPVVWRALTMAEAISAWLMTTNDFEPRVGASFRMKTDRLSPDGWVKAEVLELDPPHRMVWAWGTNQDLSTTVTFELRPEGGGTRLKLTHVGEIDSTVGGLLSDGWPGRLDSLRRSLD